MPRSRLRLVNGVGGVEPAGTLGGPRPLDKSCCTIAAVSSTLHVRVSTDCLRMALFTHAPSKHSCDTEFFCEDHLRRTRRSDGIRLRGVAQSVRRGDRRSWRQPNHSRVSSPKPTIAFPILAHNIAHRKLRHLQCPRVRGSSPVHGGPPSACFLKELTAPEQQANTM